jgi:hypothetical protein
MSSRLPLLLVFALWSEAAFSRSSLVLSVFREPYLYNVTFGLE